jgi:hypothetical protein
MNRSLFLAVVTALTAAACGGSSDGGGITAPVNPDPNLSIDASNAQNAVRVSYLAAVASGDTAGLVGNSGLVADSGSGEVFKTTRANGFAKPVSTAVSSIPFGPDVLPCDVSGSITVSGNLANPLSLTAGDIINIDADNCDDGLGEVVDGLIAMTIDAFSGDVLSGLYDLTSTLDIDNFQVTTAEEVLMSSGDSTVRLNTLNTPAVSASVSGSSLTADSNTASETLTNYSSAQTLDAGLTPAPYTMDSSGTLDSSQLAGIVDYSTEIMFQGFDNDYPGIGELLVTGGTSSARLIALDNVNVRIEIDNNDDGTIDDVVDTTWDALVN